MGNRHQNLGSLQPHLPLGLCTEHAQSTAQYQVTLAWPMLFGKVG